MHFFKMKDKPLLYAGIAAVSLTILTGLTIAVTLAVMMPIFVVFSLILVPAVMISSLLATGFIASGSLGTMGIAFLLWLYKKEEDSRYTLHARGVRPDRANKLSGGDDSRLGKDKPAEEAKPPGENKSPVENKPPQKEKSTEGYNRAEEDKHEPIPEVVKLVEQKRIGPTYYGPSTLTKKSRSSHQFRFAKDSNRAGSIFMKEYQKAPRVGAFACQYFTSRDKFT